MLSWSNLSIDSLHATCAAGARLAGAAVWQPYNWFALKTVVVFDAEINNGSWSMSQFSAIFNPVKNVTITIGNMCTLVTEQRPSPASAAGQFETWAMAQIPGIALCAKVSWQIHKNWSIGIGVAQRNDHPEYQANLKFKRAVVSAFYDRWNESFGAVFTADIWRFSETFVWRQKDNVSFHGQPLLNACIVANTLTFSIGPKKDWCLYSDFGYDLRTNQLIRCEVGALKEFHVWKLKGLLGPGYCYEDRGVKLYGYIHF
ncbi:MAG: hypothetical protein WC523_02240 [Patescibacteria group bacterium]